MRVLADALVYAVTYIDCRETEGDGSSDDDVEALETIADILTNASDSDEVKEALAQAAERALEAEQAGPSRADFIRDYESWMENVFGEGWVGNRRQ